MNTTNNRNPSHPLTQRPQWQALLRHFAAIKDTQLRELFAVDPARGERLTAEAAGLYLDYSKQRVSDESLRLLQELAAACDLRVVRVTIDERGSLPKWVPICMSTPTWRRWSKPRSLSGFCPR